MHDAEREVVTNALGRVEAEQEAGIAAPVMGDQIDLIEPQLIEQGDDVGGEFGDFVWPGGRLAPAEAAQVGADHPVALGQGRDHLAPDPPVLRPAVEEEERRPLPRFGDVQANPGKVDVAMCDSVDLRWRSVHCRAI